MLRFLRHYGPRLQSKSSAGKDWRIPRFHATVVTCRALLCSSWPVSAFPDFTVQWPRLTGAWHLESSADLQLWADVTVGGQLAGETLFFKEPMSGRQYFRLAEGWAQP